MTAGPSILRPWCCQIKRDPFLASHLIRRWGGRGPSTFRRSTSEVARSLDDSLRILFCGSDAFSIYSLKALHKEYVSPNSRIGSIEVVTKVAKRTGRGLKVWKDPPIKAAAEELGLPVHQIETFTGWNPPEYGDGFDREPYINLVIAVSFGLLIPPRVLQRAKYGGLNIHPSMLPELRGPAPLQWTILKGLHRTGVTLQSLHPVKFDEGVIVDQTPAPGLEIPNSHGMNFEELRDFLGPLGAEMLMKSIREGTYIPPYAQRNEDQPSAARPRSYGPKIQKSHKSVDFRRMDLSQILRMNRAIPQLWAIGTARAVHQLSAFRPESAPKGVVIKFSSNIYRASGEDLPFGTWNMFEKPKVGLPYAILSPGKKIHDSWNPLLVHTICGNTLVIPTITVSGYSSGNAAGAAYKAKLFKIKPEENRGYQLYTFENALGNFGSDVEAPSAFYLSSATTTSRDPDTTSTDPETTSGDPEALACDLETVSSDPKPILYDPNSVTGDPKSRS